MITTFIDALIWELGQSLLLKAYVHNVAAPQIFNTLEAGRSMSL